MLQVASVVTRETMLRSCRPYSFCILVSYGEFFNRQVLYHYLLLIIIQLFLLCHIVKVTMKMRHGHVIKYPRDRCCSVEYSFHMLIVL